jgi:hypothetical protein
MKAGRKGKEMARKELERSMKEAGEKPGEAKGQLAGRKH